MGVLYKEVSMFGYYNISITMLIEILNNPMNRHKTRVKYSCSDEYLYVHPELLAETYLADQEAGIMLLGGKK